MKFEKLGNIAYIIAGQSPPSSTYNNDGKGMPFFQGKADYGVKYPTVRYWCSEPTKISLPEDILISMRAPVGPVNINVIEFPARLIRFDHCHPGLGTLRP